MDFNILIVEDSSDLRPMWERLLGEMPILNVTVHAPDSYQGSLSIFREVKPQLLLLDYHLELYPDGYNKTGQDFLRDVMEGGFEIPAIISISHTAAFSEGLRRVGLNLLAGDGDPDKLVAILREQVIRYYNSLGLSNR